jgi:hypothetical protein
MSEAVILIQRLMRRCASRPPRVHAAAIGAAVFLAAALGGCASQPKPTAQLVRASTLVSQAEKDRAQRYAAADLQRARDELSSAQAADSAGKYDSARRLADRAAVDANLASARASSGKARESAAQVRHSLETLKQQVQQSPAPSGDSGPGQDHP